MNRYSLIHTFFVLAAVLGVSAGVSSCADTLNVGNLDNEWSESPDLGTEA